ncbi:MAG: hypothetical protein JSV21_05915 [Nitrospirota bacterium]|nr:MAG: hypothetical protein JSV21_05915 [Nitrospirota bacterium]
MVGTARWFDSFFYDERFEREENRSSLRLRFDSFFEKNEHAVYDVNASLRLILPDTNRRLRLVVAGDPDIESGLVDITNVDNLDQTGQDTRQDLNIGLSYFLIDKLRQNLSLGAGVFVKYDSPQLSLTARYKQLEGLGNWKVRMIPQLSWDTADGWSSKAGIDFDRPLTDILLFRASTQGEWFEHEEGFFYTLAASVFQSLDKKSALAYQWINNFQTEPYNHLHQTALVIRYRRNVWKDWLFLEVAPQIKWSDDKDYEAIPGILFRLETIYGYLG